MPATCQRMSNATEACKLRRFGLIYTHTAEQAEAAKRALDTEQRLRYFDAPIVTEIKPATVFWPAESYHRKLRWQQEPTLYSAGCLRSLL